VGDALAPAGGSPGLGDVDRARSSVRWRSHHQQRAGEIHMTMRHTRIVPFDVAKDGTVDLPEGATIIWLQFESEGAYGYDSRPARVWVDVPDS
jgi:hypothetical protein